VVGSAQPFSKPQRFESDEGLLAWPPGVDGSGGATTMHVVQIADANACMTYAQFW